LDLDLDWFTGTLHARHPRGQSWFHEDGEEGFTSYFKNIIILYHQYNLGVERDQRVFFKTQ
jgi:hypothetical protein